MTNRDMANTKQKTTIIPGVYLLYCFENGMFYVGESKDVFRTVKYIFEDAMYGKGNDARGILYHIIREYGPDKFNIILLSYEDDKQSRRELKRSWRYIFSIYLDEAIKHVKVANNADCSIKIEEEITQILSYITDIILPTRTDIRIPANYLEISVKI